MKVDARYTDSVEEYVHRARRTTHRLRWAFFGTLPLMVWLACLEAALWSLVAVWVTFSTLAFFLRNTYRARDPARHGHRVRSEVLGGHQVTRVDYDRRMMLARKAVFAAMLASGIILLPLVTVVSDRRSALLVIIAIAFTPLLPLVLLRHRNRGFLHVGEWGIYAEGPTNTCSMAWRDVETVRLMTGREHPPMIVITGSSTAASWTGSVVSRLTSVPVDKGVVTIENIVLNPFITPVFHALRESVGSPAAQRRFATDEGVRLLRGSTLPGERQL